MPKNIKKPLTWCDCHWYGLFLFVCWNLFCFQTWESNLWLKPKMFPFCFTKILNLACYMTPTFNWGFFTLLDALAHGAPSGWRCGTSGSHSRAATAAQCSAPGALCTWGCRVATIDGNWTGVDDNYPPNNCFPLKQDWKLPTKCVRLETCVLFSVCTLR